MVRGILYYLLVWALFSAAFYGYNHLSRRNRLTVIRCVLYGLVTATVALAFILMVVYLF
jgi:hypothetical protein